MSITATGSSWKVSISHEGQRYRKVFDTETEAQIWEAEAKVAFLKGLPPSGLSAGSGQPCTTLGELADVVYTQVWANTRGEVTALINSKAVVRLLGEDTRISTISTNDVDGMIKELKELGNSPATINRKLAALSKMLSFAFARGWINRKPVFEKLRESVGRTRYLSSDEYEMIRQDLHEHDMEMCLLVVVLVETGLRLSEAINLKWNDIAWDEKHIRVWTNKSDTPRSIPMSSSCFASLDHITKRIDSVTSDGPFVEFTLHSVRHRWDAMKKRLGLHGDKEFTPHCCRHTFASWLVQKGVPIFTVKELCGHKCIEITMRYAHLHCDNRTSAIASVFG